jgi:hypothetical protein
VKGVSRIACGGWRRVACCGLRAVRPVSDSAIVLSRIMHWYWCLVVHSCVTGCLVLLVGCGSLSYRDGPRRCRQGPSRRGSSRSPKVKELFWAHDLVRIGRTADWGQPAQLRQLPTSPARLANDHTDRCYAAA